MSIERLNELKMDNDLEGVIMAGEAGRFARLASRHADGTAPRAVAAFNLFQTPTEIAAQMADMIPDGAEAILEPSAGLGRLYQAAQKPGRRFTLLDESRDCCQELERLSTDTGDTVKQADFLTMTPGEPFDAVLMNPPFKMGRDVKHIIHALQFVKAGGRLISLCYNGVKQNKNLEPLADSWEVLPAGSFKSEGTRAEIVLLTMQK